MEKFVIWRSRGSQASRRGTGKRIGIALFFAFAVFVCAGMKGESVHAWDESEYVNNIKITDLDSLQVGDRFLTEESGKLGVHGVFGSIDVIEGIDNVEITHDYITMKKPGNIKIRYVRRHNNGQVDPPEEHVCTILPREGTDEMELIMPSRLKIGMIFRYKGENYDLYKIKNGLRGYSYLWERTTWNDWHDHISFIGGAGGWFGEVDSGRTFTVGLTGTICSPGTIRVGVRESESDIHPVTVTIEEPVIRTNMPEEVALGEQLGMKISLDNTALTDYKIADLKKLYDPNRLIYGYRPSIEIVEGSDLIQRSNGDYSHSLTATEDFKFIKTGKLVLKIKYNLLEDEENQWNGLYFGYSEEEAKYSPETTITVNIVKEKTQTTVTDNTESSSVPRPSGEWVSSSRGWWYKNADGTYPFSSWKLIDGKWYYFDGNGYMQTGWLNQGGRWYYLNTDGSMVTGWKSIGGWFYFDGNGSMVTGWRQVDGKWYYMNGSGYMQTGWLNQGGRWYYLNADGSMAIGWKTVGGWFYFDGNGAMATGWRQVDGKWYYMNGSGYMQTGWLNQGGRWYYLNTDGSMAIGWKSVGGWFYFDGNGAMVTGWRQVDGKWYYMNGSGYMQTGWLNQGGVWYYLNGDGSMAVGEQTMNGKVYRFSESGAWIS